MRLSCVWLLALLSSATRTLSAATIASVSADSVRDDAKRNLRTYERTEDNALTPDEERMMGTFNSVLGHARPLVKLDEGVKLPKGAAPPLQLHEQWLAAGYTPAQVRVRKDAMNIPPWTPDRYRAIFRHEDFEQYVLFMARYEMKQDKLRLASAT